MVERVDLVIPIDYPGFNLRLARRARELRIPVLFYIAPQVWAWHASRAKQLARDTDRVAVKRAVIIKVRNGTWEAL